MRGVSRLVRELVGYDFQVLVFRIPRRVFVSLRRRPKRVITSVLAARWVVIFDAVNQLADVIIITHL